MIIIAIIIIIVIIIILIIIILIIVIIIIIAEFAKLYLIDVEAYPSITDAMAITLTS